ncbi:MAG: hypothetical protein JWP14_2060 [Frankiales bacterium]|nr:hypothetical protein [Frankiales bacterium]
MRVRHLLPAVLLLALPLISASASGSVTVLAGTQTITGRAMAASRSVVTLTKPVVIPADATAAGCALSGSVRVVGTAAQSLLFLTPMPLSPESTVTWIAHVRLGSTVETVDSACNGITLKPGRYLLQYVHSPGTSTMTLKLPGLSGSARLTPQAPDASQIATLPSVLDTPASPATYAWGTRRTLTAQGSILTLGAIRAAAPGLDERAGYGARGDCLVDEAAAGLPDQLAYAPGCPAGGSGLIYGNTGISTWAATLTGNLAPGSYGAGFWYLTTPTTTPLGAVSVWLTNLV